MEMAQIERAQRNLRILDRRAARAKRSRWIGRLLFSLLGMGLLLAVRMNPALVGDAVALVQGTNAGNAQGAVISKPDAVAVRRMPSDAVPVRRGGALPGNGTTAPERATQAQADAVASHLRGLSPGG